MLTICLRRQFHFLDSAFAKRIDRSPPVEPHVAGQHEVDPRPCIDILEGVEHIPYAGQKSVPVKLKTRIDLVDSAPISGVAWRWAVAVCSRQQPGLTAQPEPPRRGGKIHHLMGHDRSMPVIY